MVQHAPIEGGALFSLLIINLPQALRPTRNFLKAKTRATQLRTESALAIFQKDDLIQNSSNKMTSNFFDVKVYSHITIANSLYRTFDRSNT